jgi:diacylglycerol O-acyltransferase
MPFERLSPLDASFLNIEDHVTPMHIGSVSIFEGPPPGYDLIREMLLSKLPAVRRYRQIVRRVPLDLGRPVWADDPYFNLEYHLRHTALPRPGGEAQMRNLAGRIMTQPLDRNRPLWEMWMVEGLTDDEWAIVSKVHHCMVDGVSGSDLLGLILDISPKSEHVEGLPWVPSLPPAGWELAVDAVRELVTSPVELGRALRARTSVPRRAAAQVGDMLIGLTQTARSMQGGTVSSLNGPIGPHRRWVSASVPVSDVKEIRRRFGGTFNDVVLAAITHGFRELLEKRGEPIEFPIRTLVPVSVRARDERGRAVGDGTFANKVTAVFAELPVHMTDPVDRLLAVSAQMEGLKQSKQAEAGEVLTSLTGFAPPFLLSLAGRLGTKVPQRTINTVTTNVPGPQIPLYATGRKMLRIYPYVPLGIQMRVCVAIFSYDGTVSFGITGDYDTASDIDVLVAGIEAGIGEYLSIDPTAVIIDLRPSGSLTRR